MEIVFDFVHRNGGWYYQGGKSEKRRSRKEHQYPIYKEGLHTLLQAVGTGAAQVRIHTSDEPVDGSDELELTQTDAESGYYLLKTLRQKPYVLLLRLFHVPASFGYLPPRLYLRYEVGA